MLPLSVRLAPSRFLDPLVLVVFVLAVALYLAFRDGPALRSARPAARRGRIAAWLAWGALWVLSTPFVAATLTGWVEMRGPDLGTALGARDREKVALVVLAAGMRTYDESSPLRERLDAAATQRVLTASRLWREQRFGLVILSGTPPVETEAMLDLATTLGVPAERVVRETRSLNTRENALQSAAILREHGVEAVVLVTSASHLRRAVKDFEAAGIQVIPAAADVVGRGRTGIDGFLPSANALSRTHVCLHEILGYLRG
jgi:uncharacterized SAM-binding protein YcdF (DUF218 family)